MDDIKLAILAMLGNKEAAKRLAEKAERERDEAVEVICARCSVLPCRENECYWHRSQNEE